MKITRKGYYTIEGPDGELLLRDDGAVRQVTSRDECYERITEDGRFGVFTIHCPDRTVEVKTKEEEVSVIVTEPPVTAKSVLWATDATQASPFNFDAVHTGVESSGYGYPTGTRTVDSQTIAEYPTALVHVNHFEGGQMQIGGDINSTISSFWPTLEASNAFVLRFLIKYGTSNGAAEWAGSWANGGSGGHEYKWPDIGWETDGNRVLVLHQADGNTTTGKIAVRIDGSGGQVEYDVISGLVANTLYYVEIEINGSGALRAWSAEYDGTDTEYSESTPSYENLTAHTWAPDFGPDPTRIAFGYINHNCVPAQDRYVHWAINDSFIGPGQVSSEN